jgi:hypothetical protein
MVGAGRRAKSATRWLTAQLIVCRHHQCAIADLDGEFVRIRSFDNTVTVCWHLTARLPKGEQLAHECGTLLGLRSESTEAT